MRMLLIGIAWIVGAFWFWLSIVGNPVDELALIRRARVAPGFIVDTWEEPGDGDDGRVHWSSGATYTFRLPDGREFTRETRNGGARLKEEFRGLQRPYPAEVEYLPERPAVSRIKGDGSSTIADWLWRRVGLGLALLGLLASPGFVSVRNGAREMRDGGSHDDEEDPEDGPL